MNFEEDNYKAIENFINSSTKLNELIDSKFETICEFYEQIQQSELPNMDNVKNRYFVKDFKNRYFVKDFNLILTVDNIKYMPKFDYLCGDIAFVNWDKEIVKFPIDLLYFSGTVVEFIEIYLETIHSVCQEDIDKMKEIK